MVDVVADALQANLYYLRLPGHGGGKEAQARALATDYLDVVDEALLRMRELGSRVVVIGSSTGGLLGTWAAARLARGHCRQHSSYPAPLRRCARAAGQGGCDRDRHRIFRADRGRFARHDLQPARARSSCRAALATSSCGACLLHVFRQRGFLQGMVSADRTVS